MKNRYIIIILVLVFTAILYNIMAPDTQNNNLHAYQAEAWIEGRHFLTSKRHDVSVFNNHYYVAFPPAPAIFYIPLVFFLGPENTFALYFNIPFLILSVFCCYKIFEHFEIPKPYPFWLTVSFFLGTAYWEQMARANGVWGGAHIFSVSMLIFAFYFSWIYKKAFITGLCLAVAMHSRQLTLFAIPAVLYPLFEEDFINKKWLNNLKTLFKSMIPIVAVTIFYLWLNHTRFGDPFDTGYSYLQLKGFLKDRFDNYGLFNSAYFFHNFTHLFFHGLNFDFTDKLGLFKMTADPFGISLTFGSPFLIASFFSLRKNYGVNLKSPSRIWFIIAWLGIMANIFQMLFYYNNGWNQYTGQRFSLDFLPVLLMIMAFSVRDYQKEHPQSSLLTVWKGFIVISVLQNAFILLAMPLLNRFFRIMKLF